jgi:hypothetical protein
MVEDGQAQERHPILIPSTLVHKDHNNDNFRDGSLFLLTQF